MRADRLTRKTNLKKHPVACIAEVRFYDLAGSETAEAAEFSSYDLDTRFGAPSFTSQDDVIAWCASLLGESPCARRLWQQAADDGWKIGLAGLGSAGFAIDISVKTITIDHFGMEPDGLSRSAYFRCAILLTLARALRDVWHEQRICSYENRYAPEDVLMMERARAADCDTVTMLIAWELRGQGHADIWRHLIGSAEGDMALVFTRFLERDPASAFDGSALTYAFRQWYADEGRVDGCDHETLEALDEVLASGAETGGLGTLRIAAPELEALSVLPDGTRYLEGLGEAVRRDPYFSGLRDEINQTHLFQIMYDMEVTVAGNVPFRDKTLARRLFPVGESHDDRIRS